MSGKIVLIVSNTSWSVYNFRLEIIRLLLNQGIKVIVVAPKDSFTAKLIAEEILFEELHLDNYGTNLFSELGVVRQLYRIYKRTKPDFIFHYTIKPNIYGSIAASLNKIDSIIFITGLGQLFKFNNKLIESIILWFYKLACKKSKEVWFLNKNDRDVFVNLGLVQTNKVKILPSEGINTNWFNPTQVKKQSEYTKFLFAGRLLWEKGLHEYVKAAREVKRTRKDVVFKVLGFIDQDNPGSVTYSKMMQWQREGIIEYIGETTDIKPFLQDCDCFVFPSYYKEGISRVLLEAASMKTPIITTDNVGCRDVIVDGKTGFIVEPKNVEVLVQKMNDFLKMEFEDRIKMGESSREFIIENFSQEKINEIYSTTLGKYLSK